MHPGDSSSGASRAGGAGRGKAQRGTGSPAQAGSAIDLPRQFGSRYLLLRHLATGGMADVFLARQIGHAGFVKECVIKRILPHLSRDRQFVTMFLDEARLCARLSHPNIAQVYDHGQEGDDYFIAMEYVPGVDLDRILDEAHRRNEKRLPFDIAARIVAAVADGLEHAHNAVDERGRPLGIVHRDVTPSNVVVSFEGVPKLLDFGIAKAASKETKTEVGIIKGKLPYMSPEQVQGERLDGRSDLFSLAVILYELTTGNKPFDGDNAAQLGLRILHDEPTPPSLVVGDFPEALEDIIAHGLQKRAEDRTSSARAMQLELERYLLQSGTPTTSHEVGSYLAARFERPRISVDTGDVAATRATEVGAAALGHGGESSTMAHEHHQPPRPTGPLTIGEGPDSAGEELAPGRPADRRSLGGGGGFVAAVAVVLIVAVTALFFMLRGYEQKRDEAVAAPAPTTTPTTTPTTPVPTTTPANPVAAPTPAVAPAAPVDKPATPVAAAPPKITPLAEPAREPHEHKPVAKAVHAPVHHEAAESPRSLPHLPTLPVPADPQ